MKIGNENIQPKTSKSAFAQQFTIHVDEPAVVHTKTVDHGKNLYKSHPTLQLHPDVTSLRPALSTISTESIVIDDNSPSHGMQLISINLKQSFNIMFLFSLDHNYYAKKFYCTFIWPCSLIFSYKM